MINENAIRPDKLMDKYKTLQKMDAFKILEKKEDFVFVNCPACDGHDSKLEFDKNGYRFVRCSNCETLFVNPRPNFNLIIDFYENSECFKYWNSHIFKLSENVRSNQIFEPRAEKVMFLCSKYSVSNETLVDVGAGFGTFGSVLKKHDFFKKILLVEPSEDLADTCRNKGLDVIELPIEKVDLRDVSVVTNFELIEHLYNPREFIMSCKKILKDDGLFILTTPNIKGFDLSVLNKLSNNIVAPNHLNYFNIESLTHLLNQCGFKILEASTPGKLDAELVRKSILSGEFDASGMPFLKYLLVDKWDSSGKEFQDFISKNNMSSHLWIVAQNISS